MTDVPSLAGELGLDRHPEGGWYRETWRSGVAVTLPDGRVRSTGTLIWFLLPAGESSAWRRVASDEIWLAHRGNLLLELGGTADEPVSGDVTPLGTGDGEAAQVIVPAGVWQRTLPGDSDALVRCFVSPGFDFADFELA